MCEWIRIGWLNVDGGSGLGFTWTEVQDYDRCGLFLFLFRFYAGGVSG